MRVLVLRPEPQASATSEALAGRGIDAVVAPMLEITYRDGVAASLFDPAGDPPDGLLLTSANAVASLREDPRLPDLFAVPVVAVGPSTATTARSAGFVAVIEADGDADALVTLVADRFAAGDRLVHLAGRDRAGDVAGRLVARGLSVTVVEAYRAEAADRLPDEIRADLLAGGFHAVIVGSRRTAEAFRRCLTEAAPMVPLTGTVLVAISAAAAAPLERLFERVAVAERPDGESLIDSVVALRAALENNEPDGQPPVT